MAACVPQIVSIDEDANTFTLHEPELLGVLRKVPPAMKVGVVSVVGSFRTGKSFLLSFMLRYLRSFDEGATGERKPIFRGPRQARGASEWMRASDLLWGSANTDDTARKASLGAAASAGDDSSAAAAATAETSAGSAAAAADSAARDDPQREICPCVLLSHLAASARSCTRAGLQWHASRSPCVANS